MKKLFLFILLLPLLNGFSQNLSLSGGLIHNQFSDYEDQNGHYQSEYENGGGFALGATLDGVRFDSLKLRFSVGLEIYRGAFSASDGGLGSRNTTYADVDKALFTLGFYPINFRILKRIDLNIGLEFGTLLCEKVDGRSRFSSGFEHSDLAIKDKYPRFNNQFALGAKAAISYDICINDNLTIFPQYAYYFGLLSEFSEFPTKTKSRRQYFSIGVKQTLSNGNRKKINR